MQHFDSVKIKMHSHKALYWEIVVKMQYFYSYHYFHHVSKLFCFFCLSIQSNCLSLSPFLYSSYLDYFSSTCCVCICLFLSMVKPFLPNLTRKLLHKFQNHFSFYFIAEAFYGSLTEYMYVYIYDDIFLKIYRMFHLKKT